MIYALTRFTWRNDSHALHVEMTDDSCPRKLLFISYHQILAIYKHDQEMLVKPPKVYDVE